MPRLVEAWSRLGKLVPTGDAGAAVTQRNDTPSPHEDRRQKRRRACVCSSRAQSWNRRGLPTTARLTGGGVATSTHQALPASDLVLWTPQSTHKVT